MAVKKNSFQNDMEDHLVNFKEKKQFLPAVNKNKQWQYYDISDNLYPPVRHGFLQFAYDYAVPLHDYVNHVRSSQVFAINLMYPLLIGHQKTVLTVLGNLSGTTMTNLEGFIFEYSPDKDYLGEWKSSIRPDEYVTATDIAIFTCDEKNRKYAFLIEVKFTEDSFTTCGGYTSAGNRGENRQYCDNREMLFADYNKCYLQIKSKGKSARKYFNYFDNLHAAFPGHPEIMVCPFQNNHQCLRNHAFARSLEQEDEFYKAYFVLLYHDKNEAVLNKWHTYCSLVSNELKARLSSIRASDLLRQCDDRNLKRYFKERYKVDST